MSLTRTWRRSIGEGAVGYRRKITATPVVAGGQVFTMDSDGSVSAFDEATGSRRWNTDTQDEKDRSTNVGGGIAVAGNVAVRHHRPGGSRRPWTPRRGRSNGASPLGAPARSAPTIVDNRLFVADH